MFIEFTKSLYNKKMTNAMRLTANTIYSLKCSIMAFPLYFNFACSIMFLVLFHGVWLSVAEDETNIGSRKVIENNGGKLENAV